MKDKGITKIGVITSNDGFGMAGKAQLEKLAPASTASPSPISEVYDKQATDLTGVLTKVKGQDVQAVVNWSIVPAQSLVAKNMKQIGLNVPLFQSHGFGNIKYVQAGGEAANGTIFPCGRLLVADVLPDNHPQKTLLMQYKKDYESQVQGGREHLRRPRLRRAAAPDRGDQEGRQRRTRRRSATRSRTSRASSAPPASSTSRRRTTTAWTMDAFEMLTVKDGKFAIYKK